MNDVLCEKLGLEQTQVMIPTRTQPLQKLVVFIPETHYDPVLRAVCEAGAGWIGNYSHCTFNLRGTGTFLPEAGTNPYIGTQGELEQVREVRLETVITPEIQGRVLAAMMEAHPYEEPAYDLYPLNLPGEVDGLGRVGNLPQKLKLQELAQTLKEAYRIPGLRMVGERRAGSVQGGGAGWLPGGRSYPEVKALRADVSFTSDLVHHTALDALADRPDPVRSGPSCRAPRLGTDHAQIEGSPATSTGGAGAGEPRWIPILSIIYKPIYKPIIGCCFVPSAV